MAYMIDSECVRIPRGADGEIYFDLDLADSGKNSGPEILMNIPELLSIEGGETYDSLGMLSLPLYVLLEEYLSRKNEEISEFGNTEEEFILCSKFIDWLRDYANRLESINKIVKEGQ